jgi:hypothetical protein
MEAAYEGTATFRQENMPSLSEFFCTFRDGIMIPHVVGRPVAKRAEMVYSGCVTDGRLS